MIIVEFIYRLLSSKSVVAWYKYISSLMRICFLLTLINRPYGIPLLMCPRETFHHIQVLPIFLIQPQLSLLRRKANGNHEFNHNSLI